MMLPGRPVDEQEQFVFYQSCIAAAKGGVVTVRTFDLVWTAPWPMSIGGWNPPSWDCGASAAACARPIS